MINPTLRAAVKSDLTYLFETINNKEIKRLDKNSFKKSKFAKIFLNNLKSPNIFYLIAENKKQIIGFASLHIQNLLHHCGRVAEIQEIYVSPWFRYQGVGIKLLNKLIKMARLKGCVRIEVSSGTKNKKIHKFYKKHGLKKVSFKHIMVI